MDTTESLLRAILATVARNAFPPDQIHKLVGGDRQLAAYNLCDGSASQAEIGKLTKLDRGNLSRSILRWIEAGIVVRVGKDQHPLHVYPLAKNDSKAAARARG